MGCAPSIFLDKDTRRSSDSSLEVTLNAKLCGTGQQAIVAPRASLDSDGFISQQPSQKDSFVSQMGNNISAQLHLKRLSGSLTASPRQSARRPSLALTPEEEPLDTTSKPAVQSNISYVPTALLTAPPEPLELLLLFPDRNSRVCNVASAAAARLGGDPRVVRTHREVLEACVRRPQPHVVIIDSRNVLHDLSLQLASQIRATKDTQHILLIAVVKKSTYLKDDFAVLPFLEKGFNGVMVESISQASWCAQLLQWRAQAAAARGTLAAIAALTAAVERCKSMVAISDSQQKVLYANQSWCHMVGWRGGGTGRRLSEAAQGEAVRHVTSIMTSATWDAPLALKKKPGSITTTQSNSDMQLVPCHGAAVSLTNITSHVVLVCDNLMLGDARGSLHSIRRTSLDLRSIGSDGLRRTSLAKLQELPLEAPITKVITLLSAATEGASPGTVALVERAVDMLRTCELYSPQMKGDDDKFRTSDPVATDLIGALLSKATANTTMSSRRSSNDSTVIRQPTNRPNLKHKVPTQLRDLLDSAAIKWDFEIFRLEELTASRPLSQLGLALLQRHDACSVFNVDERTFTAWFVMIESKYHSTNTYHNSTHAADVMQAVAFFLEKDNMCSVIEPVEAICSLLAAAAHDVDHPGVSSAFLCNARHPLALLYNDISVLESHHSALTFKMTLGDDRVNIFKNLDRDTYKTVRHNIVDMILATEMTKHFEHLAKFVNVFYAKGSIKEEEHLNEVINDPLSLDKAALQIPENVALIKRMMIKCADVSNASRPLKFAYEWARRIAEEYFQQTDEEKTRDLPVVMPMFDRATCSIPKSQIGFIDYIIMDMMEAWAAFIDMPELVTYARENRQHWQEMDDAGVTTVAEIRRTQPFLTTTIAPTP